MDNAKAIILEKFPQLQNYWNGQPLPSIKQEDWKYSKVGQIVKSLKENNWQFAPYTMNATDPFKQLTAEQSKTLLPHLLTSQCNFFGKLILEKGLWMLTASKKSKTNSTINLKIDKPIQPNTIVHNNMYLKTESGCSHTLNIENTNAVPEDAIAIENYFIEVEDGGALDILFESNLHKNAHIFRNIVVNIGENATFRSNMLRFGGKYNRDSYTINHKGKDAMSSIAGVHLTRNSEMADTNILVNHDAENCQSNQVFRSIAAEESFSIFNGKIYVAKGAQKTDAYQSSKNIVLGHQAHAYSRPQLEIYADDVKCSHGSTTGQLDEEALFYLRSRGIAQQEARELLLSAFLNDALQFLPDKAHQEAWHKNIDEKYLSI